MAIRIFKTKEPDKAAGAALSRIFGEHSEDGILFMLSGGSSLRVLEFIQVAALGPKMTVTTLDERFDTDPLANNFSQLTTKNFYTIAGDRGAKFIDTRVQTGAQPLDHAMSFEHQLRHWRNGNQAGKVVALMGVGEDGHTAGIMPFPEDEAKYKELFEANKWAVSYDAGGKSQYSQRVTVTNPFLRTQVDYAVAYVSGEAKQKAFVRVAGPGGKLHMTPARIVHEMRSVELYTDVVL